MYITTTEAKIPLSNLIGTEYNSVTVFRKLAKKSALHLKCSRTTL